MSNHTISRAGLATTTLIASGGMARVYRLQNFHLPGETFELVYKEFKQKILPVPLHGLLSIVRVRAEMHADQRRQLDNRAVWPLRVVEHNGAAVGVLMRLIPNEYFQVLRLRRGDSTTKPRELQFLFQEEHYCKRTGVEFATALQRLQLLRDFAYLLALLHRARVVFGDISARNILYRLGPRPSVMIVDCDAVRVAGTAAVFGKQPHSPDWQPPEAVAAQAAISRHLRSSAADSPSIRAELSTLRHQYAVQSTQTDTYKFALAVIRTLAPGPGNSVRRDPKLADRFLTSDGRRLLRDSLDARPNKRPVMRDWYGALGGGPGSNSNGGAPDITPSAPVRQGSWVRQSDGSWSRER